MLEGLKITIKLFVVTLVLSLPLGLLISLFKEAVSKRPTDNFVIRWIVKMPIRFIINVYLWVFRGTPLLLQLFFFYFGLTYVTLPNGESITLSMFTAAVISFVLNYAAYFAEIFRGGIMSIDNGQFEAGRSLGFNYIQTMVYVVIPQMLKNALPTLCNEFIALLKETSVAGYVGVVDLTKAGNAIAGRTYSYFMPLFTVAIVYLVIVIILTKLIGMLERRLRNSEH